MFNEFLGCAGLAEFIANSNELNRHRVILRQKFGNCRAHAAHDLVLFHGYNRFVFLGENHNPFSVQWLNR